MPHTLSVQHLAHITEATITFGDLTVFVGPQASGKSLVAQLWKLWLDAAFIIARLRNFGYTWQNPEHFLWTYLGEGYEKVWQGARVSVDDQPVSLEDVLSTYRGGTPRERVFYIPAQRTLALVSGGWPLPFRGFEGGTPFVLRHFSEEMRRFLEEEFPAAQPLVFPVERRLPRRLRLQLAESIYPGVTLQIDATWRKRLVLVVEETQTQLPILSWTAGQREFTPLLLALYWLLPLGRYPKRGYEWVIIEEPEMGLHSQALEGFIQALLHLLHRGYRVILTTHSLSLIEALWLIQELKQSVGLDVGARALAQYLRIPVPSRLLEIVEEALKKSLFVYSFKRIGPSTLSVYDISSLDPWAADVEIAEWGGLASLTDRAVRALTEARSSSEVPVAPKLHIPW